MIGNSFGMSFHPVVVGKRVDIAPVSASKTLDILGRPLDSRADGGVILTVRIEPSSMMVLGHSW